MLKRIGGLLVTVAAMATALLLLLGLAALSPPSRTAGAAETPRLATIILGNDEMVGTSSTLISMRTSTGKQRICPGWFFRNDDATDTLRINFDVVAVDATLSAKNQITLAPGEIRMLDDFQAYSWEAIADGDGATLHWEATCWSF